MIRYNRSERVWQVVDEAESVVASFAAGAEGKEQAQRLDIKRQSEALDQVVQQLIDRHPQLEARIVKGAMLLLAGHLYASDEGVGVVQSQVKQEFYTIRWIEIGQQSVLCCSCQDWFNGYAQMVEPQPHISGAPAVGNQVWCKHLLAFMINQQMAWPLSQLAVDYA